MFCTDERRLPFRWRLTLALLLALAPIQSRAVAFVASGTLGQIEYRVMAPDWICRGEVVSVLVVVSPADGAIAADSEVVATLEPPEAGFEASGGQADLVRRVKLKSEDVERFAFTGWKAQVGTDLGRFTFGLRLETAGGEGPVELAIPIDTIRGAAVPEGLWSILVPVAISLLALPAFALLLARAGRPGAWRRAIDAEMPISEDPWWKGASTRR